MNNEKVSVCKLAVLVYLKALSLHSRGINE